MSSVEQISDKSRPSCSIMTA